MTAWPLVLIVTLLAAPNPILVDAGVVVQVELALVASIGLYILNILKSINKRFTTMEGIIMGPQGDGEGGLLGKVRDLRADRDATERIRLKAFTEYIGWRRRVETALRKQDIAFETTPDTLLLSLLTGEAPE